MTTRRRVLAGMSTGLVGVLAGCGALEGVGEESSAHLEQSDFEGWTPEDQVMPSAIPFQLPESVFETQRRRTMDLLEAVPEDPAIPNAQIRQEIREDRANLETRIEEDSESDTDIIRLKRWHRYRTDAAEVFGSYRAASGNDDASLIAERRTQVQEELSAFESSIDYSAASTLEAVLAYAPVEDRLDRARHTVAPRRPYPDNPVANVEQAGRAYEAVEAAAAAVEEARVIRSAYQLSTQTVEPQWSAIAGSMRQLDIAVNRTRSERIPTPETAEPESIFEYKLSNLDRELYRFARRHTQGTLKSFREAEDTHQFATAVIKAGQSLTSIAAFDGTITAIRNGDLPDEQTVASVRNAASDAHETLQAIPTAEYPFLSAAIGKPAVLKYHSGVRSVGEQLFDPSYAEASFRYAALLGAATPDAASFITDRLKS